ncbi:MAG: hypothetical protein ACRDIY_05975 [Chloroflexota bacterium]
MKSGTGWAVAVASLAIWILAPVSWTQAIHDGGITSVWREPPAAQAEDVGTGADPWASAFGGRAGGITITTCDSSPTPAPVAPTGEGENATPATPSAIQSAPRQTFRLCGASDAATERAIEQLIAGRSYRATLVSRSDGCADLTIAVSPGSGGVANGQQSTNLSVGSGSGGTISARIVSQDGATRVTIGSGN